MDDFFLSPVARKRKEPTAAEGRERGISSSKGAGAEPKGREGNRAGEGTAGATRGTGRGRGEKGGRERRSSTERQVLVKILQ
jgi:hypothetical protein